MRRKINILTLISVACTAIIFTSCSNEKKAKLEDKITDINGVLEFFDKELELKAEVYLKDTLQLLNPFSINIIDKYLFINDRDSSTFYSIYDMEKKAFIGRFLNIGRGPNEVFGAEIFGFKNDSIAVLDVNKNKLNVYSFDKVQNCENIPDRVFHFSTKNSGDRIRHAYYYYDRFICSGLFKEGRFHTYFPNGKEQMQFDNYPKIFSDAGCDNYHLGYIFSAGEIIRGVENLNKLACVSNNSSLSIYTFDKSKYEFDKTFYLQWFLPKVKEATYNNGRPYVVQFGKGYKIGAGNLAINDRYLFFPFSQYEFDDIDEKGIQDWYGYIIVADWEGNPVARLKLDRPIKFPLEIDNSGNYLYSIHTDDETGFLQIIRFDISFLNDI